VNDVDEARHSREPDRIAFISPKRAGVSGANEKEKQNECREQNRDGPFCVFEEFRIHVDPAGGDFGLCPEKRKLRGCE